MPISTIQSPAAPLPIGPYAQAIRAGDFVFLSGQIPLDPSSGEIVSDDVTKQAHQVMKNLQAVIQAAGGDWSHVVRTTIYLTDMKDFATVNEVYGSYVHKNPPARATVQVAALPRGARVEIDAVIYLGT